MISATGTITGSNLSTGGNVIAVNGSYSGFLSVAGNIYANSIVSPQTLIITDPLVYFQSTQTYPYTYDIGFYSGFTGGAGNTYQHTGLVRDYTDNTWKLFSNVPEPAGSSMDLTNAIYDPIMTGNISVIGITSATGNVTGGNIVTSGSVNATGNITGGNISISGVTTLTGNVTSRHILPAANVTYDLGSPTQMWRSIYVSGNTIYVGTSNLNVTDGNLSVGSNPVVTVSPTGTSNTTGNMNVVGNITGSNVISSGLITATGNVTGNYVIGNGTALTSITAANIVGTVANTTYALTANAATYSTNAIQANIANIANSVAGSNVSGIVANATYALTANASTYATNAIQANIANIANSVTGSNVSGTVANATYATSAGSATTAGTVTTASQGNITSVGTLVSLSITGNTTSGNILTGGLVSATGNITGNYLAGNGSQLTGMYGNANVATYLPTYSGNLSPGNISSVAGTITGVVIPKANTVTDGTSISINTDLADLFIQTNTQTAGTLTINAPSGTPVNGQKFMIRLSSTAIQTFSWNAIYVGSTDLPLPTASSGSGKYDYLGFIYNSTATKWQLLAKTFGF